MAIYDFSCPADKSFPNGSEGKESTCNVGDKGDVFGP